MISQPKKMTKMVVAIAIGLLAIFASTGASASGEKILLKDVSTLVFSSGEMTKGRRSPSIPQMTCKGGYGICRNSFIYWC